MKTCVSALILLVLTVGFSGSFAASSNDAEGPAVPLPPFRVTDFSSYLGFTWNAALKDDKIATVRFSRVEPKSLAARAGLMIDDHLVAIDGHPIRGLELNDLQRLFARKWKGGDTLTWEFTVERGAIFTRQHTVRLQMKTKAAEPEEISGKGETASAK